MVLGTERWQHAIGNSLIIAFGTTALATTLGTLTAIGLSSDYFTARRIIMPLVISPLIVPVVITAVGSYLFYARWVSRLRPAVNAATTLMMVLSILLLVVANLLARRGTRKAQM